MSAPQFTLDAWEQDGCTIVARGRGIIAICPTPQSGGVTQCVANAHLIAAAPDLYEALAVSTAFLELEAEAHRGRGDKGKADACDGQAALNRALLAKARGEAA